MSPTRLHENIAELTIQLAERPLDAKLQTWLTAEHGPSSPAYDRLKHACDTRGRGRLAGLPTGQRTCALPAARRPH